MGFAVATPALRIITEGDDFYAHALKSIRSARRRVRLMIYIWQDDEVGRAFERALIKKAVQGVDVELVVDAIGSFELPAAVITRLTEKGVAVFTHHRLRLLSRAWFRYLIRRNHRKILIVDDRIAYTGGFNIMRECSRRHYGYRRWLDMMAVTRHRGLIARLIEQYEDAGRRARHSRWATRLLLRSRNKVIVVQGGRVFSFSMSRWLKRKMRKARRKITIAMPYFIPYGFYWRILTKKLRENVEVEIILSEGSDLPWIDAVSFHMARKLQKRGARILLYHGEGRARRFSHTKFMQIDSWLGTGSANYDYRSMVLNLDTLVFVRGEKNALGRACAALKKHSRRAEKELWNGGVRAWLMTPFRWLL